MARRRTEAGGGRPASRPRPAATAGRAKVDVVGLLRGDLTALTARVTALEAGSAVGLVEATAAEVERQRAVTGSLSGLVVDVTAKVQRLTAAVVVCETCGVPRPMPVCLGHGGA